MNTLAEKKIIKSHSRLRRTNTLYKPGTKRVLYGHDRKQVSMPPVLLHTSWALGAGFAFGRHFTISEEEKKEREREMKKNQDTAQPRTQYINQYIHLHTVVRKSVSGKKAKSQAQTLLK